MERRDELIKAADTHLKGKNDLFNKVSLDGVTSRCNNLLFFFNSVAITIIKSFLNFVLSLIEITSIQIYYVKKGVYLNIFCMSSKFS